MGWYHFIADFFGRVSSERDPPFRQRRQRPSVPKSVDTARRRVVAGVVTSCGGGELCRRVPALGVRRGASSSGQIRLYVLIAAAGGLAMALMSSFAFGRFYGGR